MRQPTRLDLLARLGMSGVTPPFPVFAFIACAVAQLVEALCYKPVGRGFDFRLGNWNFLLT